MTQWHTLHLAVNPSNSFQKFPCHWISLKYFHLNDHFSRMSSLSSLQTFLGWAASTLFNGYFYKDCLGLFGSVVINWATCSDSTFLGNHRFPLATVGSGLRMLPHVYLLSTQSPPAIWPVNTLLIALLSCCLYVYLFIIKIFRITLNILDYAESSTT